MKLTERILASVARDLSEEFLQEARSYRILDFSTREGSANAKLHKTNVRNQKVEIFFKTLSDESWSELFDSLSAKSLHFANLLSESYSEEFESLFLKHAAENIEQGEFIRILINGRKQDELCEMSFALFLRIISTIEDSPWKLLLLFGRGKDESMLEINERRRKELKKLSREKSVLIERTKDELSTFDASNIQDFWNAGEKIDQISYSIKADELPAATLKRLDALPLLGIEEKVESEIEAAYEKIARLAQSYGLGF